MVFGLLGVIFRAILIIALSFLGIAVFRMLEERARRCEHASVAIVLVLACNLGKVLSAILAVCVVLWPQILRMIEYI